MQLEQAEIAAWIGQHAGKQGEAWPAQRTLHAILRGGELHRFEGGAHVLVCRTGPGSDAHLITTGRRLAEGLSADEQQFVKRTLTAWKPTIVWVAWLQRDVKMGREHAAIMDASGLRKVTSKKLRGWAISVSVTMGALETLMDGGPVAGT
jgi:hypothetical protein